MRSISTKSSPILVFFASLYLESVIQATTEPNVNWDAEQPNTLNFFFEKTTVGAKVGSGEIIDISNNKGAYDAGFVCSIKDITSIVENDVHIIRIEPQVTEFEEYGPIIHHMDLFACQDSPAEEFNALKTRNEQSKWCQYDRFLETNCKQILWAYDKGADAFDFPEDTGILLGPNSGFNSLLMQVHYLLPENYEPDGKGFEDESGFRLITEPVKRSHDLGMFGFIGTDLDIPPGEKSFEWRAHLTQEQLNDAISADFKAHGKVYPVAVHLHGHDHMIGARLEHYRDNKLIGTYGEINPYHGYGHDQTFINLKKPRSFIQLNSNSSGGHSTMVEPLLEGDSLTFVCTYDSTKETVHMHHGVSHGDEMCGPLVMYYPKARGHDGRMTDNVAIVTNEQHDIEGNDTINPNDYEDES